MRLPALRSAFTLDHHLPSPYYSTALLLIQIKFKLLILLGWCDLKQLLHRRVCRRLSVFRDDVIFLIYLYQRWVYRVDKTRANEFGWVEQQPEGQEGQEGEGQEGAAAQGAIEGAGGSGSGQQQEVKEEPAGEVEAEEEQEEGAKGKGTRRRKGGKGGEQQGAKEEAAGGKVAGDGEKKGR